MIQPILVPVLNVETLDKLSREINKVNIFKDNSSYKKESVQVLPSMIAMDGKYSFTKSSGKLIHFGYITDLDVTELHRDNRMDVMEFKELKMIVASAYDWIVSFKDYPDNEVVQYVYKHFRNMSLTKLIKGVQNEP